MTEPVPSWMLISAVRYALGRQTYVVQETTQYLLHCLHKFDEGVRAVIIQDIRDAVERAEARGTTLGMDIDHDDWKRVLDRFHE